MGNVQLSTPRLRVIREGFDDLDELQTTNADLVLWDKTRFRHKWPPMQEGPFVWLTFIAWAAARRTGAIPPELTYEAWESSTLSVEALTDDEDEEAGAGRPTLPDLGLE